jgi:hypothetical protein
MTNEAAFQGESEFQSSVRRLIHAPDLQFAQYTIERFRINRGTYNTIDAWLFREGWTDIRKRRAAALRFLAQAAAMANGDGRFVRFGHGNLSKHLARFAQDRPGEGGER